MNYKKEGRADLVYCRGCIHLCMVANMPCCNYLFNKDRRRPCPAGEGCTVKERRKRKAKKAAIDPLPCKRCGGSPEVISYRDPKAATNPTYIECTRCGETTGIYNRKYKAVAAWNEVNHNG